MATSFNLDPLQIAAGVVLGIAAATFAYRASLLSLGGAIAAAITGSVTLGIGGLAPSILLITFFVSSSLLSRWNSDHKQSLSERSAKGGRRDEWQVIANGVVPAFLAMGYGITQDAIYLVGATGALAASNADTWATEVGVLARENPRIIINLRPAEAGTSGAISPTGSVAALAGGLLIGLVAATFAQDIRLVYLAGIAGLLASMLDSVLGATLQAQYHCPHCDQITEKHPVHGCGTSTVQVRGWAWLGNDQVNLIASAAGAATAVWLWIAIS